MVDIDKVQPGDILYTVGECFDEELETVLGRISICVQRVDKASTHPILAHGQIRYSAEALTDVRPAYDKYMPYGEGFADYLKHHPEETEK